MQNMRARLATAWKSRSWLTAPPALLSWPLRSELLFGGAREAGCRGRGPRDLRVSQRARRPANWLRELRVAGTISCAAGLTETFQLIGFFYNESERHFRVSNARIDRSRLVVIDTIHGSRELFPQSRLYRQLQGWNS